MATIRFGAGMYILRREAEQDLFGVLENLREIGYDGVELLGFFGKKPAEIKKKLDETGLTALGDHVGYEFLTKEPERIIGEHLEVGCGYLTVSLRQGQYTPGTLAFDEMARGMRNLVKKCMDAGITAQYHNHGWDVAGSPSYADQMLGAVEGLCFEPDIGWMVYACADPAKYLRRYADRCRVLHFKDVYASDYTTIGLKTPGDQKGDAGGGFEFRPTGYGTVNFPALMPLCLASNPDWIVVDHDLAYERNPYEDLRLSYEYTKALTGIAQ